MAQFYSTIKGARGEASRLGNKASGMRASIMSYQGCIDVRMGALADGNDWVTVWLRPHPQSDKRGGVGVCLFNGPCNAWDKISEAGQLGRQALLAEYMLPE
jgi:hypothetical protein